MKSFISTVFMFSTLFGGGYWYFVGFSKCITPIEYRIGFVDSSFALTDEDVRSAVSSAESFWEEGTGRDLFVHDPEGDLVINFVYDERQANADAQRKIESTLDRKEDTSASIKNQYDNLVSQYEQLRASHEIELRAYEQKLALYNEEVAEWNERGGAPKDIFERLTATQESITRESERLGTVSDRISGLIQKINTLGAQGNTAVSDYNSLVEEYNDTYTEEKEFTQGEYTEDTITIYEFTNREELTIVLAHEMGHALGIEHVLKEESLMYHHMGKQILEHGLTQEDKDAFHAQCEKKGSIVDVFTHVRTLFEALRR